jgi:Cyclic-phosphate processing Receiver domain
MKLWLDDLRAPPDDSWHWCTSNWGAKAVLEHYASEVTAMSLDNDLGEGQEEGRRLVLWMAENNIWPSGDITIHSANPVAGEYMRGMIDRYRP